MNRNNQNPPPPHPESLWNREFVQSTPIDIPLRPIVRETITGHKPNQKDSPTLGAEHHVHFEQSLSESTVYRNLTNPTNEADTDTTAAVKYRDSEFPSWAGIGYSTTDEQYEEQPNRALELSLDQNSAKNPNATSTGADDLDEFRHQLTSAREMSLAQKSPKLRQEPAITEEDEFRQQLTRARELSLAQTPPRLQQESAFTEGEDFDDVKIRLSNEFIPIVQPGWDTLIYIGPPAQQQEQDDDQYEYIKKHFSRPYLMCSTRLKETGSSVFTKLLGPTSARAARRLKKIGLHVNLPDNREPTYYIDLRPPQDDDDAVLLLTELQCTPGVLSWHRTAIELGVVKSLIAGSDDLNYTLKIRNTIVQPTIDEVEADVPAIDVASVEMKKDQEAYTVLRHHTTIERLLHAIAGNDPELNSAPKVWTFFAVAKYFDCATFPHISNWIYSWLYAEHNANFVQANPEVSYRMALGLKAQDLTRVTFALLVGEKALLQSQHSAGDPVSIRRPLCHLDDDEVNRLDHAARSLSRRIIHLWHQVANETTLAWMLGGGEVMKLFAVAARNQPSIDDVTELWRVLRDYARGEMYRALSQNLNMDQFCQRTVHLTSRGNQSKRRSFSMLSLEQYNQLSLPQRLLTQNFWEIFKTYGFAQESSRISQWASQNNLEGLGELAPEFLILEAEGKDASPPRYHLSELVALINTRMQDGYIYYADTPDIRKAVNHDVLEWSDIVKSARRNLDGVSGNTQNALTLFDTINPSDRNVVRTISNWALDKIHAPSVQSPRTPASRTSSLPETMLMVRDNPPQWIFPRMTDGTTPAIIFHRVLSEMGNSLREIITSEVLRPGWADDENGVENEIPIYDVDTLVCLSDDEWKFLPLWAGGCDDGTGGVFVDEHVPDMEGGFRGGKRGLNADEGLDGLGEIEMGEGGAYSMIDGSDDFEDVATDEGVSTAGKASRWATDGSKTIGASTVMSLDE